MSKIYIYYEGHEIIVKSNGEKVNLFKEKNQWMRAEIQALSFEVSESGKQKEYEIHEEGNFVLIDDELSKISENYQRVLLVTDIDGTLYHPSEEGQRAYQKFLRYWAQNFEFNGSKLVYNTGKPVNEYKSFLYQPDFLVTLIGNYAYSFDNQNLPKLAEDYRVILGDYNKSDWDSQTMHRIITEKFDFSQSTLVEVIEFNILFIVSQEFVNKNAKALKDFLKNKENLSIQGLCFHCKLIISKQQLSEGLFLEIVPSFSGKNNGIYYSQHKFGFANENCLVSGDSYNDIDLFKYPVKGVLVGNAESNIKNWLSQKPRPLKYQSQLNYAEAIIEALENFKFT